MKGTNIGQKLIEAEISGQNLLEASIDPLLIVDLEGKISAANNAAVQITGLSRDDLKGTALTDYFTEPELIDRIFSIVSETGSVSDFELAIRRKDGELISVICNANTFKDREGNVIGVFVAARDISARKKAEAELVEQLKREIDYVNELEKFQKIAIGRELKMLELKKENEALRKEIMDLKSRLSESKKHG